MAKRISKDNEAAVKEIDKSVSNKFRWDWLDKTVKLTIKTSKGSEEVTEKIGDFIAKIDVPVNWFDCLLLNYSSYPPEYLELIDKLLEYHDEHLHSHVVACNVSIKDFLNLLLDTAFYTVVNNDDWLKCWDHILSNHPSYLLSVLIAFITESKSRLMSFSKREHFLEYFSDKTEMDINSVIKEAYRFHKSTPSHVHARNIYPHFRPFPTDYVLSYMMGDAIPEHQPSSKHQNQEVNSIHKSMLSSVKQKLKEESHNEKYKISVHEQRLKALHDEYLENEKELQKLSICNPIVEALQHDFDPAKTNKNLDEHTNIEELSNCNCHLEDPLFGEELENKISLVKRKSTLLKEQVSELTDELAKSVPKESLDLTYEFESTDAEDLNPYAVKQT
ncbi:TBC1 domain family member 31 [Nymphon striatum]|nr:TBC1 domain family member 31 [Nymphon striatum]KAG1664666.1 TBC1 domain family member 31 [Nymphon striatum]